MLKLWLSIAMEADCVSHSIIIIILVVYFLQENFKTSLVIPLKEKILEKSDICLFSSRTRTKGADDSNFGPKQGGGGSESTVKASC